MAKLTTINEEGMFNLLGAMVEQSHEDIAKADKVLSKENATEEDRQKAKEFKEDAENFLKEMKTVFGN